MDPIDALREIAYLLERRQAGTQSARIFRHAANQLSSMTCAIRDEHQRAGDWRSLPGLDPKVIAVISHTLDGHVPDYLVELRTEQQPLAQGGAQIRAALKGDLHCHSAWSDGSSSLEEMMTAAKALGYDYQAITDHSPVREAVRGLSAQRLMDQVQFVGDLNYAMPDFRVLSGIDVEILPDGRLDQDQDLLLSLDVVVASAHTHLSLVAEAMTQRLLTAIANPATNVLSHGTDELATSEQGVRSAFDAEAIFAACREFNVAVEINTCPKRRTPPDDLLELALGTGCYFSINTDAHAPGELEWIAYGCETAEQHNIPVDRIINLWDADRLLDFCRKG